MSQQHAQLFKQFARGAADHCSSGGVRRVSYVGFRIGGIDLAAGKGMKAAEKRELIVSLYPENFRILQIGVLAKKNYCSSVFRDYFRHTQLFVTKRHKRHKQEEDA